MKILDANIWDFYGPDNHVIVVPVIAEMNNREQTARCRRGLAAQAKHKFPRFPYMTYRLWLNYGFVPKPISKTYPRIKSGANLHLMPYPFKPGLNYAGVLARYYLYLQQTLLANPNTKFYFPRIGCGNGGFDWATVKNQLVEMLNNFPNTILVHNSKRKAKYEQRPIAQLVPGVPQQPGLPPQVRPRYQIEPGF